MMELTLGVYFADKNNNVIVKRAIGKNWHIIPKQDLKNISNIYVEDEIASILEDNLKLQLTKEVIRDMLNEIKEASE